MAEQNRKFPISIAVIAVIAVVFGLSTAAIIVSSRGAQQDNPVIVLPTVSMRRLGVDIPAPDFTLNTLAGKPVSLKGLRGKPVLINFWASWCPPCLQETPDLVAAYKELGEDKVTFIGIGTQDDTDKLAKFASDNNVPYLIVEDPKGTVGDSYSVLGLPMTILVDSTGTVRKVFTGPVTKDQVVTEMRKLS
jgi:cytochrome c biogenesis protein CcmG/thiol:disulfide interchange protein DsbE